MALEVADVVVLGGDPVEIVENFAVGNLDQAQVGDRTETRLALVLPALVPAGVVEAAIVHP